MKMELDDFITWLLFQLEADAKIDSDREARIHEKVFSSTKEADKNG